MFGLNRLFYCYRAEADAGKKLISGGQLTPSAAPTQPSRLQQPKDLTGLFFFF